MRGVLAPLFSKHYSKPKAMRGRIRTPKAHAKRGYASSGERLPLSFEPLSFGMSKPRIRIEVQVMFFDTDCGGVVSNIAYLRFIEMARTRLAEELGLHLAEMAETQQYPVVVRTEIDYRRAAKLADELVIEGWLDRIERARFWCAFHIVRKKDNALIAECRQMLALIEMPAGKLLRLPEHWEKYRTTPAATTIEPVLERSS